jgi:uncharacterized protein (TIGR00255 family)
VKIVSMTGFGQSSQKKANVSLAVEIRTVNSRYLDFNIKLPREYSKYELEIQRLIAETLKRGRVDLCVTKQLCLAQTCQLNLNRPLFDAYINLYRSLSEEFCPSNMVDSASDKLFIQSLLAKRDIVDFTEENIETEVEEELLFSTIKEALQGVLVMRLKEGEALARDLSNHLTQLECLRTQIKEKSENTPENYQKKLLERLLKLSPDLDIDPQRLAAEVAIFADRVDISEELTRLRSHFDQIMLAAENTPNGRTIEFLIQECGREFNTIASKAQSAEVQALTVSAKACLEKVREQLQNIE